MKHVLVLLLAIQWIVLQPAFAAPTSRSFNEIIVLGNQRFDDRDVLATSGLTTGVILSETDLIAAVEALELTGEFQSIRITSKGDVLTIRVKEEPQFSGGLSFGLGYDSDRGITGLVDLRIKDALRKGSLTTGRLLISEEEQRLTLEYVDPTLLAPTIGAGIRLSYEKFSYDTTLFNLERARITPFLRFALGQRNVLELRAFASDAGISDVAATASDILQGEEGKLSSAGLGIGFRTQSAEDATVAWRLAFDIESTGTLGADTDLLSYAVDASAIVPLPSRFALRSSFMAASVEGRDGDTPSASERFALGGAALRGFDFGGVTARDIAAETTNLGGEVLTVLRNDVVLPWPNRADTYDVFLFHDIGAVWRVSSDTAPSGTLEDDRQLRRSTGLGVNIETQIGRFEAYYAFDINGEDTDDERAFGLTFRSTF